MLGESNSTTQNTNTSTCVMDHEDDTADVGTSLQSTFDSISPPVLTCQDNSNEEPTHIAQLETDMQIQDLSEYEIKLAATYVDDAIKGQHSQFEQSESSLRLYQQYQHYIGRCILCIVLLCHLSLALFEKPSLPGYSLPYWGTILIETCCLAFYCWRMYALASFTPTAIFWRDPKYIVIISCVFLTLVDMIVYSTMINLQMYNLRFSRVLRPVLCACWPELRSVRVALRTLKRALPAIVHVVLLYCALLVTAALMAYKMLGHKNLKLVLGQSYFATFWDSLFDLYVLVTTANHPDIMMPAFNQNMVYVLFFAAFLILCYFIYMNIILAVIYNSYKHHLKAEVLELFLGQQKQLQQAFDLIARPLSDSSSSAHRVTLLSFQQLMMALPSSPRYSLPLISILFAVLDTTGTGSLGRTEFLTLAELLSVKVSEVQQQSQWLKRAARAMPGLATLLTTIVNSKWFQYFFDALTVVNALVIGFSNEDSKWDAPLDWLFLSLFLVEIFLKLLTLGFRRFFRRLWNTFDFFVIGSAFIIAVVEAILSNSRESRLSLDVLLVLRVLRLFKILGNIKSFQMIVFTLAKILPSLRIYGGVILMFYYSYAILGMELFGGAIASTSASPSSTNQSSMFPVYCGNPALANTTYWRLRYCNNNFNDLLHAFILLFELTVVNQWHVLAYGFSAATHGAARLYFVVFHLVCVTLLLNVFTAFVLEVFLLEYSAGTGGVMETQLEKKIHSLGLSAKRSDRRKASTISQQELVMEDSDVEEDDGGYVSPSADAGDDAGGTKEGDEVQEDLDLDGVRVEVPDAVSGGKEEGDVGERKSSGVNRRKLSKSIPAEVHDTTVRFHLSKNVRSVEVLLQKMFREELQKEFLKLQAEEESKAKEAEANRK